MGGTQENNEVAATVEKVKRPGWSRLQESGCEGVEAKGLIRLDHLALALLRFLEHATIHEHPAEMDVDVICLEGEGFTSIGRRIVPIKADETIRWPAGIAHWLRTKESRMITLMVEHLV